MRVEALAADNQRDRAHDSLNDVLARHKEDNQRHQADTWLLTARGRLLHQAGDLGGAVATLKRAVAGYEAQGADANAAADRADSALARIELGNALADQKDSLASQDDLDRALALLDPVPQADPLHGEAQLTRARILTAAGRPVAALEILDQAERAGVLAVSLHTMRGELLLQFGREAEAYSAYRRGLDAAPRDAQKLAMELEGIAQRAYDLDQYQTAVEALAPLAERHLLSAQGMGLRAEVLRLTQHWHEALDQADEALRTSSAQPWTRVTKAAILTRLSRSQEALDLLRPVVGVAEDPTAFVYRATALDSVDKTTEALTLLRQYLRPRHTPRTLPTGRKRPAPRCT